MEILVVFTCFNRKEKTRKCITDLVRENRNCSFTFIAVDDSSTDGTQEMLKGMNREYAIHLVAGDGNLFYSGGMRTGMDYALSECGHDYDYLLMVNDDVEFLNHTIENIISQSKEQNDAVIVGAIRDSKGNLSYSAVKYTKGIKYRKVTTQEWKLEADTFNANCVLIPYKAFLDVGSMDVHFVHSLGDFDYGLMLKRRGFKIHVSKDYVGICENNPSNNSWTDKTLSRKERLKKKQSPKGAPAKQWFYYLKKNFGLITALKGTVTPYIRILLGL